FVDAITVVPQRDGADRARALSFTVQREQDPAAVGQDVLLRVAEHFLVERLDHEPAAQPLQVQAREIPAPARVEFDDLDGGGGWRGHPAILVALAPVVARRQRPRPTVVGRDEAALEAMELFGTRLDPEALGQRAPAFVVVAVPLLGDVAAGAT